MTISEIRLAKEQAESELRRVDMMLADLAEILAGRLRQIKSTRLLKNLKRELQDFNSHTQTWK